MPAQQPQVVEPAVKRREVEPAAIDTENFEAGAFVGTVSIEDFGSSLLYGARIAYHFTEDLFAEATVGSSKAGKTSYEELSGSVELLTDSERQFTYYDLALGWNALPGEVFCQLGIKLRSRHPGLFPLGYANGNIGYIPTAHAYPQGGYEIADAYKYYCYPPRWRQRPVNTMWRWQ